MGLVGMAYVAVDGAVHAHAQLAAVTLINAEEAVGVCREAAGGGITH